MFKGDSLFWYCSKVYTLVGVSLDYIFWNWQKNISLDFLIRTSCQGVSTWCCVFFVVCCLWFLLLDMRGADYFCLFQYFTKLICFMFTFLNLFHWSFFISKNFLKNLYVFLGCFEYSVDILLACLIEYLVNCSCDFIYITCWYIVSIW